MTKKYKVNHCSLKWKYDTILERKETGQYAPANAIPGDDCIGTEEHLQALVKIGWLIPIIEPTILFVKNESTQLCKHGFEEWKESEIKAIENLLNEEQSTFTIAKESSIAMSKSQHTLNLLNEVKEEGKKEFTIMDLEEVVSFATVNRWVNCTDLVNSWIEYKKQR